MPWNTKLLLKISLLQHLRLHFRIIFQKHYYSPSNSHWLLNCILRCTCVYKILFLHFMLSPWTAMWKITISQNTVKCPYNKIISVMKLHFDRLCGLVVIPGYRSRGPGSIPGAARFSE
jgi:hypothetical protein